MNKFKKYTALALTLALMAAAAGCGSEEEDTPPETDETIGSGAGANTEIDLEPEKQSWYISKDLDVFSAEDGRTEIVPGVMNRSEETVEGSWQGFLLDGEAVNWHVEEHIPLDSYNPDDISFPMEPNVGRFMGIILEDNIYNYSELTVQASIIFSDGREPLPLSATFRISELERPEDSESAAEADNDDPLAAGMAAYREIVTHADTYDYTYEEAYLEPGSPTGVYHYALVLVQTHHDVPALLVKQDGDTGFNIVKVFQYVPEADKVFEPGTLPEGVEQKIDRHMSLYVPTDRRSIIYNEYRGDNEFGETRRYTFGGGGTEDNPHLGLQYGLLWSAINSGSNIDTSVEETGRVEIEWYDITDMTGLENGRATGQ